MKSTAPSPISLELLSPARDLQTGIAAINHGADAVYIGASHHGARSAAGNSIDDIRTLADYAHKFRARVYVTVNTLIYETELESVRKLIIELYNAGVDALIVQDMALLEMDIPPIELHASTQCDTRTVDRAVFLAEAGFEQIVLPREFSTDQIRQVHDRLPDVKLEGFVHGALCVSYSGDCRASFVSGGRSANRGECAQICRLPYDLVDKNGKILIHDRHLLSLRDMNRLASLGEMADAGICSFKIEGRLKSADYVSNITAAYSQALDRLVEGSGGRYRRASAGRVVHGFNPDPAKSFNRGFTDYFLSGEKPGEGSMGSHDTPKSIGEKIGTVIASNKKTITIKTGEKLNNGDGLGFFDMNKRFVGFRANRVDGNKIYLAGNFDGQPPVPGTTLFRNFDKAFTDTLNNDSTRRVIDIDMTLETFSGGVSLTLTDSRGASVTSVLEGNFDVARSPQEAPRRRVLERLGDTIYTLRNLHDLAGAIFIPASALTDLRRRAIEMLDHAAASTRQITLRKKKEVIPSSTDIHPSNVANSLAEKFYTKRGVDSFEKAIEVDKNADTDGDTRVMTTRYCLRRELGACLKKADGAKLPSPLFLRPVSGRARTMRLDFDCKNCEMNIYALPTGSRV